MSEHRHVVNALGVEDRPRPFNIPSLSFSKDDIKGIVFPHDDPLVLILAINGSLILRVLVDGGSSANIFFTKAFDALMIGRQYLIQVPYPIIGFNGSTVRFEGSIVLQVRIGEGIAARDFMTEFLVVDVLSAYNAIVGRPMIHDVQCRWWWVGCSGGSVVVGGLFWWFGGGGWAILVVSVVWVAWGRFGGVGCMGGWCGLYGWVVWAVWSGWGGLPGSGWGGVAWRGGGLVGGLMGGWFPDKNVGQFPMACVVRKAGSNLSEHESMDFVAKQILPRVVLEAVPKDLLRNKKHRNKAIDLLITECKFLVWKKVKMSTGIWMLIIDVESGCSDFWFVLTFGIHWFVLTSGIHSPFCEQLYIDISSSEFNSYYEAEVQ
uniref:Uncharacterized protein n=1 Tax=Chenopodium quinoa TaxID=63459 RepID=A0A803MCQ7_CHEQI